MNILGTDWLKHAYNVAPIPLSIDADALHKSRSEPSFRLTDLPWDCQCLIVRHSLLRPYPIAMSSRNPAKRMIMPVESKIDSPLNLAATCRDYWALREIFYSQNTFTGREKLHYRDVDSHRFAIGVKFDDKMTKWAWSKATLEKRSFDMSPCWITHLTLELDASEPLVNREGRWGYTTLIARALKAISWRVELKELSIDFKCGEKFEKALVEENAYKRLLEAADTIQHLGGIDFNWDMRPSGAAVYAWEYLLWGSCKRSFFTRREESCIRQELFELHSGFLKDSMRETQAIVDDFNQSLKRRRGLMAIDRRVEFLKPLGMARWRVPTLSRAWDARIALQIDLLMGRTLRTDIVRKFLLCGSRHNRLLDAVSEQQYWADFETEKRFWLSPRVSKFLRRAEEDIEIAMGMLTWDPMVRNLIKGRSIWDETEILRATLFQRYTTLCTAFYCLLAALLPWIQKSNGREERESMSYWLYANIFCHLCLFRQGIFLQPTQWAMLGSIRSSDSSMTSSDLTLFDYINLGLSSFGPVADRFLVHLVFVSMLARLVTLYRKAPLVRTTIVSLRWLEVFAAPIVMSVADIMIPDALTGWDSTIVFVVSLMMLSLTHIAGGLIFEN